MIEFNDRRPAAQVSKSSADKPYTVITQHVVPKPGWNGVYANADRKVKRVKFATFEEAKAHTEVHNPDTDGSMFPNVDEKFVNHKNYSAGGWWNRTNRHAAIHYTGPPRD